MLKLNLFLKTFLSVCFILILNIAQGATFTVNSLDNTDDGNCDSGHCSLHEAIDAANASPGADNIVFSVTGTITLSAGIGNLPVVSSEINIDGAGITLIDANEAGLRYVNGAANSVLQNITIDDCKGGGVTLQNVDNFSLMSCMLINNGLSAGSTSTGNGFTMSGSSNAMISGNSITNNQESGVFFDGCNNADFSNNTVQNNGFHGIVGLNSNSANFDFNNCSNNGFNQPSAAGDPSSSGIIMVNTMGCTITNNTVEGSEAEAGILLVNASGCSITGNTACQNFKAGIWLIAGDDCTITGNEICNNSGSSSPGILLQSGADNNTIQNNNITGNQGNGVQVLNGNGNEITENTMSDNNDVGIGLSGGNSNAVEPVITAFSCSEISGSVGSNAMIHVYEADPDSPCQGMTLIGSFGPFSGTWAINNTFDATITHAVTATLVGSSNSTSEFVCFEAICDDGCALTTDSFNSATCECEFTPPSCDDNCPLTTDTFNEDLCECENIIPDCDDNCPLTVDSFNENTCQCENVEPDCNDNCPQTDDFFDNLNCECVNIEPSCDDGCSDTVDSFNTTTCQCEYEEPDCTDMCPQTIDSFNSFTCECENEEPDCDDGCELTMDSWENSICGCENIEPNCNDGCAATVDSFNANTCECENIEPDCDDGCELTIDSFNSATCECENVEPDCDDGCVATTDSFNAATCECENVEPDCDDFCALTVDSFNPVSCECENVEPSCDDNCEATTDFFNPMTCECENTLPDCDDGCELTEDSFNADTCECENLEPDPDDGCELTTDTYDAANCTITNTPPSCDDNDCATTDSYDADNCACINDPIPPPASMDAAATLCEEMDGTATFNLLDLNMVVNMGTGNAVTWMDADGQIANPGTYVSGSATITAEISDNEMPVCQTSTATVMLTVQAQPTAEVTNTATVCNTSAGGSILNLDDLITGGDMSGTWTDVDGAGVDLSNTMSVDFDGVDPDMSPYTLLYTTNSAVTPCEESTYEVEVFVENCSCPSVATNAPMEALCNDAGMLDLTTLEVTTESGTWTITSPMSNPPTIVGDVFDATGAPAGDYEITFTLDNDPPSNCANTSTQTVTIVNQPFAGMDAEADFCNDEMSLITLADLIENEDANGTWAVAPTSPNIPDGGAFDFENGTFNPFNHPAGTYVFNYTVESVGCMNATASVTINLMASDITFLQDFTCEMSEVGVDTVTLNNQFGCDSLVITTTDLLPSDTTNVTEFTCNPDEEGMSEVLLENQSGCDSLLIINTIFDAAAIDSTFVQEFTCDEAMVGTIENMFEGSDGCDSIVFVTTDLLPSDTTNVTEFTCNPDEEGMSEVLLENQSGCDSLLIINTIFDAAAIDSTFVQEFTCDETMVGTIENMFEGSDGCDSIVFVTTDLLPSDTTNVTEFTCNPDEEGMSEVLLENQAGCDSLLIINTIFDAAAIDSTFVQEFTCDETMVGTIENMFEGSDGCDSIVFVTTDLLPSDTTNVTEFTCNPDEEGMSEVLLENQSGCDSLLIINTIFDAAAIDSTFVQEFTCDETMVGMVENMFEGSDGCDSIVFVTTDLLPSDTTNVTEFTCNPDEEGMSEVLLENQSGCDSLLIINTIFDENAIDTTFAQAFTCDETMVGTVENMLVGTDGCDSIVFVTTDLLPSDTTNLMEFTCNPNNAGTSEVLLQNQAGCDSLLIINTIFDANALDTTILNITTCDETMIGTTEMMFTGSDGCDSLVITETVLGDAPEAFIFPVENLDCNNTSVELTGDDLAATNSATFQWQDATGMNLSNEETVTVTNAGIYTYIITNTNSGCTDSETIEVIEILDTPTADAGEDMVLNCDGTSNLLDASASQPTGQLNYEWFDPSGILINVNNESMVEVTDAGIYALTVINIQSGCSDSDEVVVMPFEMITAIADNFSTDVNTDFSGDLLANDELNNQAVVTTLESEPENGDVIIDLDGNFTFIPENNFAGTVTFDYTICLESCPEECSTNTAFIEVIGETLEIPDAFSPNDDGKNDTWVIPTIEQFPTSYIRVINRWGDILFEERGYQNNWAGTNKNGEDLPAGTYYYLLVLDYAPDITFEGTITIVR